MARVPVGVLEPVRTTVRSRREALRGALAAVGVLAASWPVEPTGAKKKKTPKKCKKPTTRCGKKRVKGNCCPGKPCGNSDSCECGRTNEGETFCFERFVALCEQANRCIRNTDCPPSFRCVEVGDCDNDTAVCLPPCGFDT